MSDNALVLGNDQFFLEYEMAEELRSQHLHVVGATGTGKSRFLLSMILQDIKQRKGLCLIDPHGELVEHVLDWLGKNETIRQRRTIHLLDLKDQNWSFGFNPLGTDDPNRIDATVNQAVSAMASVMGGEDLTQTPLLRLSLNAVCMALAYARLTLNEAQFLLSPNFPEERLAITSTIQNPTYARVWEGLNTMAERNPRLYLEQFQPAERRFVPFIANRFVQSILGQSQNTLDLKECMDKRHIVLVDLSREGGYVPQESTQIIGRLLVNNLVARAYERTPGQARPFNLYIDEVQNYLSGDVPEILSQCRKFGLHLTLAHQYLQQLREAGELVYRGVMGTARSKVCFALDDPEDADIMQRRIFVGKYDFERPKESLIKPTVVGHEIIKLWSEGQGTNESVSNTESQTQNRSFAEGYGNSSTRSEGSTIGTTSSSGEMYSMLEGEQLDVTRHSQSMSEISASSSSSSEGQSESFAAGKSMGQGRSQGQTQGTSSSRSYSEALRPIFQDLPTAVYSLEEQRHIFTDLVISLPKRTAFAVLPGYEMTKIETLDVPNIVISPKRKQRLKEALKSSSSIHQKFEDVPLEMEARFQNFMSTAALLKLDEGDIEPP